MNTVPADLVMMLLGDARLPVAGHTQSAGLEPAVQHGLSADDVPVYIAGRLATCVRVEVGTAVVARHLFLAGAALESVASAWAARTPSPAIRTASRTQARALLRICTRLWPESGPVARAAALSGVPRAVALGAAAATVGLSGPSLARLVGYDDVQTVAAAALKLVPLDPATATGWVHDALPAVASLAEELGRLTDPGRIPATAAPQIELWAQAHARSSRRLFSA